MNIDTTTSSAAHSANTLSILPGLTFCCNPEPIKRPTIRPPQYSGTQVPIIFVARRKMFADAACIDPPPAAVASPPISGSAK